MSVYTDTVHIATHILNTAYTEFLCTKKGHSKGGPSGNNIYWSCKISLE